jgi:hypothetical protein
MRMIKKVVVDYFEVQSEQLHDGPIRTTKKSARIASLHARTLNRDLLNMKHDPNHTTETFYCFTSCRKKFQRLSIGNNFCLK